MNHDSIISMVISRQTLVWSFLIFGLFLNLSGMISQTDAATRPVVKAGATKKGLPKTPVSKTSPAATPKKPSIPETGISVGQATQTIQGYIDRIETRKKDALRVGSKEEIMRRYTPIFQRVGVVNVQSAVENHTNVWMHWSGVCDYHYDRHQERLTNSLNTIKNQGYAKAEDMAYLEKGMASWSQYELALRKIFEDALEAFGTERAYRTVVTEDYTLRNNIHRDGVGPYGKEIELNYNVQHILSDEYERRCKLFFFSALDEKERLAIPDTGTTQEKKRIPHQVTID